MRTSLLALLACLLGGSTSFGQDWAKAMFDHTSHNFGVVARGAKVEHRFTLENLYLEDMGIAELHSSCKCIITEFSKEPIKTYQKAEILVTVDTRRFLGRKDATLKVVFAPPFDEAAVQLHVYCYIRSDVVFQPGVVGFGSVDRGEKTTRQLKVSYAPGRPDWQILNVETANPHLEARASEVSRGPTKVIYDLLVTLRADAPVGYLKDHLILITNDHNQSATRVPLTVEGVVVAPVSVSPSPLPLGVLRTGQAVTRNLVVHGKTPFHIVNVAGPDERFRFALPEAAKPVQLIPVTFTADDRAGKVAGEIRIRTDLDQSETLVVKVDGLILAQKPETSPNDSVKTGALDTPDQGGRGDWHPAAK